MSSEEMRRDSVWVQANVPEAEPADKWQLDGLAAKVGQYCFLLQNLTGDVLRSECGDDYEQIRKFLHRQGVAAYQEKVRFGMLCFPAHGIIPSMNQV
jgi:preprotein translocase subunit SecA